MTDLDRRTFVTTACSTIATLALAGCSDDGGAETPTDEMDGEAMGTESMNDDSTGTETMGEGSMNTETMGDGSMDGGSMETETMAGNESMGENGSMDG